MKGFKRLWILNRLKNLGAAESELLDVYTKQIRPLLGYAVPVWHPNLTQTDSDSIERVQKSALKIILQEKYESYDSALTRLKLEPLHDRRHKLCTKFALKAEDNPKFNSWFERTKLKSVSRRKPMKYCKVYARKVKYEKSY